MATDILAQDTPHARREFGRIYPRRPEWLARQAPEAVLEPELAIVDTHHHFLDLPSLSYRLADWQADTGSGHRIEQSIHAEAQTGYRTSGPEALRPVGETEFVLRETQGAPGVAAGIVGFADLMLGAAVEEPLGAHMEAARGRFRGIRYSVANDPSPAIAVHHRPPEGVLASPAFHAGLATLAKLGLSLDSWAFFHQQGAVAGLARQHPDLQVVACHCGGLLGYGPYAGRRDEVFAVWRANVTELAKCPNVVVKLGGILGRLAAYDYLNTPTPEPSAALARVLRPYILTLVDLFGPDRCMFESNYPVDAAYASYATLWNTFKRITADLSPDDKKHLYSGTARRIYRV